MRYDDKQLMGLRDFFLEEWGKTPEGDLDHFSFSIWVELSLPDDAVYSPGIGVEIPVGEKIDLERLIGKTKKFIRSFRSTRLRRCPYT